MRKVILHIDFNSYFATVEQQANPRLRGRPIGVTGGDRTQRTVVGAASIEAKKFGVRTGMSLSEAQKLCPEIILVKGDSEKYLECTKRFLNILKNYTPFLEVFSIDEAFLEFRVSNKEFKIEEFIKIAEEIKSQISTKIGEWITCSIGISYNKTMAKLAGNLFKQTLKTDLPSDFQKLIYDSGIVVIPDQIIAEWVLDRVALTEICGIGYATKRHLNNMGVFDFKTLRQLSKKQLVAAFKSYGVTLWEMSRGIYSQELTPFYEKAEVKSIGHQHTINHDIDNETELKQLFLKLSEMISRRLRKKKLLGKTIHCFYRAGFDLRYFEMTNHKFYYEGMQATIRETNDGLDIFKSGWESFLKIWQKEKVRMVSLSISNLVPEKVQNISLLPEVERQRIITKSLDRINDRYGEFTLQRGILLTSYKMKRMPNSFLSDRRFKI